MELRPYQVRSVDAIRAAYSGGARRVLYVLPTGGGKTIVGASIVRSRDIPSGEAWERGRRAQVAHAGPPPQMFGFVAGGGFHPVE